MFSSVSCSYPNLGQQKIKLILFSICYGRVDFYRDRQLMNGWYRQWIVIVETVILLCLTWHSAKQRRLYHERNWTSYKLRQLRDVNSPQIEQYINISHRLKKRFFSQSSESAFLGVNRVAQAPCWGRFYSRPPCSLAKKTE
jgi:hypothetical protein